MSSTLPTLSVEQGQYRRESGRKSLSPLELLASVLRHARHILVVAIAVALVATIVAIMWPPAYTSSAAIMAQAPGGSASRLAGLASQFGVSIGSAGGGPTPELYADLLRSENVLRAVVDARYQSDSSRQEVTALPVLLHARGTSVAARRSDAVKRLRRMIVSTVDDQSGLVRLSVTTASPRLSLLIASQLIAQLDRVNGQMRQKQADAETQFIEARLGEQAVELRQAQDRVADFLVRNRQFQSDPPLAQQYARLTQTAQMKQDVYSSLSQGFQQLRIDAARNTPSISVVEEPLLPDAPIPKNLPLVVIVAAVLGGAFGVVAVFTSEYLALLRANNPTSFARVVLAWRSLGRWPAQSDGGTRAERTRQGQL